MQAFYPTTDAFGAILPSNSPGVHSLWVPAVAFKTPLVLKPGREEPWTPFRVIQAFLKAGIPRRPRRLLPDRPRRGRRHPARCAAAACSSATTAPPAPYKNDPRVELHGPGYSKVILGDDAADHWREYLDVIVESIAANGGRSCVNASAVWTPKQRQGDRRGPGRAARQGEGPAVGRPRAADRRRSPTRRSPRRSTAWSTTGCKTPGATDVTEQVRGSPRLVQEGRLRLAAADDRILRLARTPAGEQGVPVPVRRRDRVPAGRRPPPHRPDAGRHGADGRRRVHRGRCSTARTSSG